MIGAGFWSRFQVPGWLESNAVELVAVCDHDLGKARDLAERFGCPRAYSSVEELLDSEKLDFVDIIAGVDTHLPLALQAINRGVDVVCQKPLAESFRSARRMVEAAEAKGTRLFANENFRWQAQLRRVREILDSNLIGSVFKTRISFCSSFPVFENQPSLAELEHFIIADVGSHVLDVCRFLLGEAKSVYCQTLSVTPGIKGEDVANIFLEMESGGHCFVEMSYASILREEVFPQTLILLEGEKGSIELGANFEIQVATREGVSWEKVEPKIYPWADKDYAVLHSSVVDTQANILKGLQGLAAETTGIDNLETVRLVWASYESAKSHRVVELASFEG
uniref:Gfo/Idh/MocA family protein n=1 Tax=Pelagicoccus albus TaxID=415222 RepID=UPI001C8B909F